MDMKSFELKRLVAVALSTLLSTSVAYGQELREVTIGLASKSLIASRSLIGQELGVFEKNGIKPKFVYVDTTTGTATALMAGSIQFAMAGVPEAISAQSRGQNMVVLASNYRGLSGTLVLSKAVADKLNVRADAPLEDRLKALDGLIIASTSATSNLTTAFKGAAEAVGARPRFTFMALPAMIAALESGAVQGFAGTAPFWAVPIVRGTGVAWISGPQNELPSQFNPATSGAIVTMRAFAEKNPDVVNAVQASYADLSKAVMERPGDVKTAVIKLIPDLDSATLDIVIAKETPNMSPVPLTVEDISHEVDLLKSAGAQLGTHPLDPAALLWSPKS